ncbi:MAG TPA: nuclear transport factor 2 family protein, partial [Chitinophagaceae bacterium]|nr:nuclear transport factor 2 family protein [Chitinophagaceae bacterium]
MKKILFNLLIISITCNNLMGQTTTGNHPEQDKVKMKILDDFAKAFNAHDVNAILSFMTSDCIFEASAGPEVNGEKFTGQEAVRKAFENVFKTFPDAHWADSRHFISGDRAVSEWTFTGTKQDGSKVEVTGCDLF